MAALCLCAVCCRPTTMWCSRCQQTWYCNQQHLEQDWPRHRRECIVKSDPLLTPPFGFMDLAAAWGAISQVKSVSAIHFSAELDRPQIVPISCLPARTVQQNVCPTPLIEDFFWESQPQSVVLTRGLNGDRLRFPLHLFYCPVALARGTPVNRAIHRITGGAAPKAWSGAVLVLKFNGTKKQGYTNASLNDLTALSAYFLNYH